MLGFIQRLLGHKRSVARRRSRAGPSLAPLASPRKQLDDRIVLETSHGYGLRVVGSSHHQSAIRRFYGRGELDATLVQEPDNPYDPNAIRVMINDVTIGHLERDTAAYFTYWIQARRYDGRRFKAPAMVEDVIFDEGQMRLFMVGLRVLHSPPRVVGDLDPSQRHAIDLLNRQTGAFCIRHMARVKGDAGAVTLDHLANDGLADRRPCEVCGKSGFALSEQGYIAKFGYERAYVESHSDTSTVSGWDM